jgi:hypothetical protein
MLLGEEKYSESILGRFQQKNISTEFLKTIDRIDKNLILFSFLLSTFQI